MFRFLEVVTGSDGTVDQLSDAQHTQLWRLGSHHELEMQLKFCEHNTNKQSRTTTTPFAMLERTSYYEQYD